MAGAVRTLCTRPIEEDPTGREVGFFGPRFLFGSLYDRKSIVETLDQLCPPATEIAMKCGVKRHGAGLS